MGNDINKITFEKIYKDQEWSAEGNGSGRGSTLEATKKTRQIIKDTLKKYSLKSLADVPCGAMAWMPTLLSELGPDFKYLGLDVTKSVIDQNKMRFKDAPNWKFETFDISKDIVPTGYDLILCRDTLQHLPYSMIIDSLENFSKSESKYILIGSYMHTEKNTDIPVGGYFEINLLKYPFLLPEPIAIFSEMYTIKSLLLYSITQLFFIDFDAMRDRLRYSSEN